MLECQSTELDSAFSTALDVKYADQMIQKEIRVNNEFYVCPVYNEAIQDGKKIVIMNCKNKYRQGQNGTWITNEMEEAYNQLHQQGVAHSAEAWSNGMLVGGLYGIKLGKIFFGESMFSLQSNASKFAFINYVQQLQKENVVLIDCQLHTNHLESLGAKMISRDLFTTILAANTGK